MTNPYESSKLLEEYLLFHYGKDQEIMPWVNGPKDALGFTGRTVESFMKPSPYDLKLKALDVGCAVGGSSFILGKYFGNVLGMDYSESFINVANRLTSGKPLKFSYLIEGDYYENATVAPPSYKGEICFEVGDASDLPEDLSDFDLVHAANLICRLPNPLSFLNRLPKLVKHGGQLLLATPFTWLEEFTPRANWIGGSGNSKEKLEEVLNPWFELEHEEDLPFLIREHQRKFQYSFSWGTRWRRK